MKKFFKTTITIEILSEAKYNSTDLEKIAYDITDGDCSGRVDVTKYEELTPEQTAKALLAQGSDPEFFGLSEDGEDLEEENDWTRDYSEERDHESYMENEFKKGDSVIWCDPDEDTIGRGGSSSGLYTVIDINGEELTLKNSAGSEVGAYASECRHVDPIWKEIRDDFEDDGLIHIDAWTSEDGDESGKVIAKINSTTGHVTYFDDRAKTDKNAQEVINNRIRELAKK